MRKEENEFKIRTDNIKGMLRTNLNPRRKNYGLFIIDLYLSYLNDCDTFLFNILSYLIS
jgi:hypothetical protein